MRRILAAICLTVAVPGGPAAAQIVPPAPGVKMPQAHFDRLRDGKNTLTMRYAWVQKAKRIREAREAYIQERGFYSRAMLSPEDRSQYSVTGTVRVPVIMVKYGNTGADPYPTSTMSQRLFTGPHSPRTLTEYYTEISYGDITMTGDVYGWTQLSQSDTFYEGPPGCNGLCGSSNLPSFVSETLTANDGSVDFSIYDNDGPDGVPNSGDDDGFVDFVAFVQPEFGGECGGTNMWSHRFVISQLLGAPFTTNDPRFGGGFIQLQDYVIQPAFNCGGVTVIDIGVFCHEFGHAFGLPDLYDTDGGSQGIGEWGLMGAGNWNTPANPAHMSAWSKSQLGWISIMDADGEDTQYSVSNVEFNRTAYRLGVMEERWRRMTPCAITGSFSMRCGLTAAEGTARGWADGDGYGDGWIERLVHDFNYDGVGAVNLSYSFSFDTETGYDYAYVRVNSAGNITTVNTYNSTGSGNSGNINIAPFLTSGPYQVSFEFESDASWSDRDGNNPTSCGPFVIDNVNVIGGGENHSATFETREDGWYADMAIPAESFYLTNRQPVGSDVAVYGSGGISIWHINEDIARTGQFGNQGGPSDNLPHGVAVEQADGLEQLGAGVNRGDGGDPFPGSTNNTLFNNGSSPSSMSYTGLPNNVSVQLLSGNPANGGSMDVLMRGGWTAPVWVSHNPSTGDNDQIVDVSVNGSNFAAGCEVELVNGPTTITAAPVEWLGKDLVMATMDLIGVPAGLYDLVLRNPGGASVTVVDTFRVKDIVPTALRSFAARHVDGTVQLEWVTSDNLDLYGWHVYRAAGRDEPFERLTRDPLPAETRFWVDERPDAGHAVIYQLTWFTSQGEELAGHASLASAQLRYALSPNYPNPFNPTTVIPFELASPGHTTLRIYDLRGKLVRTLVDEPLEARAHAFTWDGRNDNGARVSSGVYFYKLVSGTFRDVRKLTLLK